jgi:hypothetical protein
MELMGETLAYAPRKAIKSQILADFVTEWTDTQLSPPQIQEECWTLYFDGSVMKTGAGAGLLFVAPSGNTCGTLYASTSPRQTTWLSTSPALRPQDRH